MSDQAVYRVTMRLSGYDLETAKVLQTALDARSKADAISQGMAIARTIVESIAAGKEVLIRAPGSDYGERILLPKVRAVVVAA